MVWFAFGIPNHVALFVHSAMEKVIFSLASIFFCLSSTHAKWLSANPLLLCLTGPVNNIQVVRRTVVGNSNKAQSSWKKNGSSLPPPPLEKYERSGDNTVDGIVIVDPPPLSDVPVYSSYHSADLINEQVRELQVCVSSVSIKNQHFFSLETLFFTTLYLFLVGVSNKALQQRRSRWKNWNLSTRNLYRWMINGRRIMRTCSRWLWRKS